MNSLSLLNHSKLGSNQPPYHHWLWNLAWLVINSVGHSNLGLRSKLYKLLFQQGCKLRSFFLDSFHINIILTMPTATDAGAEDLIMTIIWIFWELPNNCPETSWMNNSFTEHTWQGGILCHSRAVVNVTFCLLLGCCAFHCSGRYYYWYHYDKVCSFTNKVTIGKKLQRLKEYTDNYKQAGTVEQNPIKMEKMAANKDDFFYKGLNS